MSGWPGFQEKMTESVSKYKTCCCITIDLEGWISLYPHSGVCIFGIWFDDVRRPCLISRHSFHFGIILFFWNVLDVTLVRSNVHLLFTNGAFAPTADMIMGSSIPSVTYFSRFCLIGLATLRALFVSVTYRSDCEWSTVEMVIESFIAKELSIAQLAKRSGSQEFAWTQWSFSLCEI